jgi:hypothetical protein
MSGGYRVAGYCEPGPVQAGSGDEDEESWYGSCSRPALLPGVFGSQGTRGQNLNIFGQKSACLGCVGLLGRRLGPTGKPPPSYGIQRRLPTNGPKIACAGRCLGSKWRCSYVQRSSVGLYSLPIIVGKAPSI